MAKVKMRFHIWHILLQNILSFLNFETSLKILTFVRDIVNRLKRVFPWMVYTISFSFFLKNNFFLLIILYFLSLDQVLFHFFLINGKINVWIFFIIFDTKFLLYFLNWKCVNKIVGQAKTCFSECMLKISRQSVKCSLRYHVHHLEKYSLKKRV